MLGQLAMRSLFVALLVPAALACAAVAPGCSSSGNGAGADAAIDGFGIIVDGNVGSDAPGDSPGDGGSSLPTRMRLAHASPDLGPVDFCWRPHGAQMFTGPVLTGSPAPGDASTDADAKGADAKASDAQGIDAAGDGAPGDGAPGDGAPGDAGTDADGAAPPAPGALVFGAMTPPVTLPTSGTFDVALVAPGQATCYPARLGGQVTLDANKSATVVIMGLAGLDAGPSALAILPFNDGIVDPQRARVRFIHAAMGSRSEAATPSLSVRSGLTPLASEVDPMKAATKSTVPDVDALGYATVDAIDGPTGFQLATVGDAALTTWWTQADPDVSVQVGTAHTGILVSLDQGALGVMWCSDQGPPGAAPACKLLPAGH